MDRARLIGPIWTATLLRNVFGDLPVAFSSGQDLECDGLWAKRAIFFAKVCGLDFKNETRDGGTVVVLSSESKLDPAIVTEAASEIMSYFGRKPVEVLVGRRQMILARAAARVSARTSNMPTRRRSNLRHDQVLMEDDTATHEGFFLTRTYSLRYPEFSGGLSSQLKREVFEASDAALVLPYDAKRDRVMLVEQFRMGPYGRGDPHPWVLEPVAGRIDAGETPEAAAYRECLEETDLTPNQLEHISSHYCSPGCSTEFFHCFLGLADLPDTTHKLGGLHTEHEDIRRHVLPFDEVMALMQTGEINIGPLFLMLLWLERERPRLRARA